MFRTLLRDRIYGYFYDLYGFVNAVPPAQTIDHLILIIKNDLGKYDIRLVQNALLILDGLTCIDMVKEFKELPDYKNPYFKEACRYFSTYVMQLRQMATKYSSQP